MDRFWNKVDKTGGCWLWTGAKFRKGYGQFRYEGKNQKAHRVSYRLSIGPIPEGLWILHSCDTPSCVRPDHLRPGTHLDNVRERGERNRTRNQNAAKTHCPREHEYTEENTRVYAGRRFCRSCNKMRSSNGDAK